jgi:PAS domain S-box-containing protein
MARLTLNPRNPSRRTGFGPLLGGFILLAFLVAVSMEITARERILNANAQSTLITEDRLSDIFSTMREAENGSRGYLITGNAVSLDTYQQALRDAPRELATLDVVLVKNGQQPEMLQLHSLVHEKLAQVAAIVADIQAGNKPAAAKLIDDDLRLGTMVDLRNLVTRMRTEREQRLLTAEALAARDGDLLQAATIAAVLGTLLLALLAARANATYTAQLRAADAALRDANAALERKVEERTATLNASEARFRTLAESIPALVFMTDPRGKLLYMNPQTAAYTGRMPEALIQDGWVGLLHPEDEAGIVGHWRACVANAADFEYEFRLRRADGAYRWFLGRATTLRDAAGAITAWIGTNTDIHERREAASAMADANAELERRVAARSEELDLIFRVSTDILTISNFDRKFLSVSPAWERITGHPREVAYTSTFIEMIHPDDRAVTIAARERLEAGLPSAHVNRFRRADGGWVLLSWRAVPVMEQGRIFAVARDITAEREREEQLRQSQKMEVVGQLTGGVAHDFNNLLTIIMGSLELLQRGLEGAPAKLTRRVEAATDAAHRAANLTHRLLAFSRRQPLDPRPLDAGRLLAGMSDMLHRILGEDIAVEIVSAAGLWTTLADANQLENAILNLAVNARDAMEGGGKLSIETQNIYLDEHYAAAVLDVQAGQYVMIAVTDTGCGMTPEIIAKVFEPFFTTKPAGQGTGLGLAQVYGFIKQSGGHVNIYSEPGHGSTVKLYLPRLKNAAAELPSQGAAIPLPEPQPGRGALVLIVEDEPGVRQFAAEVLTEQGYHVLTAGTAAEALDVSSTTKEIRLLFTDIVLAGGTNGRELAGEIQRRHPETTVLFTTGYTRNAIIHQGRLDDGIHFLGKPFTATALAAKVGTLLAAQAALTPGSAHSR